MTTASYSGGHIVSLSETLQRDRVCGAVQSKHLWEGHTSRDGSRSPNHPASLLSSPSPGDDLFIQRPAGRSFCNRGSSVYPSRQLRPGAHPLGLCWVILSLMRTDLCRPRGQLSGPSIEPARHGLLPQVSCQLSVPWVSWSQCSTSARPVPL